MRTFVELISRALGESFEKPEHNAWEGTPAYRPGPVIIPVKAHSGKLPAVVCPEREKRM